MPIVSTGQFTITDVNDSPLAVLSNESAVVPSATDGSSPVLTGCVTTISVNLGGVDDSANWSFSATPSSGVTGTLSARTYTVTGFTVDAGWVDLTATRVGWPSLVKRFNLSKTKQGVTGATGAAGLNGLNFSEAKLMFTDPTFQVGTNSLGVYNNNYNGTVTHTRIAKLADSPFTDSGFNIEIANTGAASPGIGGFYQGFNGRASAVFVQRIVAKVPVGYYLEQATNQLGDGSTNTWITSKAGTGKFEEYILIRRCGATGSFSSSGHIYAVGAAGTPAAPVKWWLAYATTYDFTALGFSTVVALLSNDSHTVPTDSAGNDGNFTGAATTLTIYNGTTDDSANWSVTAAPTNITGTLSGKTYTVTALSADTGYVDLTATRGGFSNVVKRFTLSKSKGGVTGAQGVQGVQGPAVVVTPSRAATFTATDGALDGSQTDIVFAAAVSGVTSPTYAWTFSGLQTNPTASTTSTQTVTAAQFGDSRAAIVTCTVSGAYTDKVSIVRLERSTAAAGANQTYIDANGTVQGVSSGAGTTVDNSKVIVGGRNLLLNSNDIITAGADYPANTSRTTVTNAAGVKETTVTVVTPSSGQSYRYASVAFSRYPATLTDHVLSFEYKTDNATSEVRIDVRSPNKPYAIFSAANTGGAWVKGSVICNWDITVQTSSLLLLIVKNGVAGNYIAYRSLKFEVGNKATDWSPSPEDVQAEINKALTQLSDIASDSVLAPAEKREVRKQWDVAINEKAGLNSEAGRYTNAAAANTAYNAAIQALGTYLNGGAAYTLSTTTPPAWINDASLTTSTAIVGTTFRTNWQAHFVARQALANKITEEAGKVATWGGVTGTGKPADNATRNVHRGNWASGTSYVLGDTVIHQGYGWSCILATNSVAPPTYPTTSNANWTLAAVKGEDAKAVYLTATSQVLKVDRANVVTPSSITLTATGQNCTGSPVFNVTSGTATLTGSGNTRELAASQMTTDQVTVEVVWDGRSDLITLSKIREGAEALTVLLSNESHVVQADQDGSVASFAGSGTDVVVYQGSSPLVAVLGGSPGTFAVGTPTVTPAGAYVPGTVTHLGDKAVLADATAMAADTAVVTIPVTVTRTDGTVVTFSLRQSVVKARRGLTGPTFRLLASAPGFRFVDGLANPPDQALVISALRYGSEAEVVYELVDGGGEVVLSGAGMLSGLGAAMGMPFTQSSDDAYLSADVLAGRQSVTVRATCGDLSDSVTLVRLNDSTAQAGATVGAPPGTNVGSTPAETVESNANTASSAVFDPATGLAQRMRANADNVLGGVLVADATTTPVGMRVGSVTWNAAGDVTGGSGVAITPKGVYARNPSKTTFVLDATTGDATFSGNLTGANITGATGTFSGSLTAETLGSLAQPPLTITSSQSVTVPAGMNSVRYELVGGGGGGGGGATAFAAGYGGGGGSGAYMSGTLAVTAGASLTITIGSGGSGGANTLAGGNGTASSIGALVTAAGGTGGGGSAASGGFGTGGATPTSVPTAASKAGATAARVYDGAETTHNGYGKFDGEAKYDGAGFPKPGVTGAGGANPLGTGGASVNTGVGFAGTGYGSGGSGGGGSLSTNVSAVGGAGRPGMCRLTFLNSNGVVLQSQLENLKQVLAAQGIAVA